MKQLPLLAPPLPRHPYERIVELDDDRFWAEVQARREEERRLGFRRSTELRLGTIGEQVIWLDDFDGRR